MSNPVPLHHYFLGLNGWEKWSYAAAILGVIINAGFFAALIWQVRVGRAALKEAKRTSEASLKAVQETAHTRIDAQTPRVSAFLEQPLIHGFKTSNSFGWTENQQFILPKMNDDRLYFIVDGTFTNEGKSTARIRMNSYAQFLPDNPEDDFPFIGGPLEPSTEERMLRPGETVRFTWSDSHSLKEWADAFTNPDPPNPLGALFMEVIVSDSFAEGVVDHIYLEMSGRPLEPVEGNTGRWKTSKEGSIVAISYPIVRTYRNEGQEGLQPSWLETYEAWNQLHNNK